MWVLDSSPLHRLWATSDVDLELRSLPSPGVTRLRRYYEPLRHPRRPRLSLAGFRLAVTRGHRWGFPCSVFLLCPRAVATTPVGLLGACIVRYPSGTGLPRYTGGSAPTSLVSRPAQRSLTLRPADSQSRPRRPTEPKALTASLPPLPLWLLPARTIAAGRDCLPLKKPDFTAHCVKLASAMQPIKFGSRQMVRERQLSLSRRNMSSITVNSATAPLRQSAYGEGVTKLHRKLHRNHNRPTLPVPSQISSE